MLFLYISEWKNQNMLYNLKWQIIRHCTLLLIMLRNHTQYIKIDTYIIFRIISTWSTPWEGLWAAPVDSFVPLHLNHHFKNLSTDWIPSECGFIDLTHIFHCSLRQQGVVKPLNVGVSVRSGPGCTSVNHWCSKKERSVWAGHLNAVSWKNQSVGSPV